MASRETGSETFNTVVIAASVIGSFIVVAAIVGIIACMAYCRKRLVDYYGGQAGEAQRAIPHGQHNHHRRRRRRRRRQLRDSEGGEAGEEEEQRRAEEELQLENPELQAQRPPSYHRANQYSSIETGIHVITNEEECTHVSMYIGDDDETIQPIPDSMTNRQNEHPVVDIQEGSYQREAVTPDTLPPTYSTAQMELSAQREEDIIEREGGRHSERGPSVIDEELASESVATAAAAEGSLPPTYSTAKLELMRRKAVEQDHASSPAGYS